MPEKAVDKEVDKAESKDLWEQEHTLDGCEWRVIQFILKLQKGGILPFCPWDSIKMKEAILLHMDEGFGVEWKIFARKVVVRWEMYPDKDGVSWVKDRPVVATFNMKASLPVIPETNERYRESRRSGWGFEKIRVEENGSKSFAGIPVKCVFEAEGDILDHLWKSLG